MRTQWKLSLVAAVFLVAIPLTVSAATPGGQFWDDDGNVHEAQIEAIAASRITLGCALDLYCPHDPVTRGQMAAFWFGPSSSLLPKSTYSPMTTTRFSNQTLMRSPQPASHSGAGRRGSALIDS